MSDILLTCIKWAFIITILLLAAGCLFEYGARLLLERKVLKERTFININGVPLHYVKKGRGNCTVVLQSGMGSSHAIWKEIQDSLAPYAVTIAYDRNGLMFSEESGIPVTNNTVTEELEQLLEKTHCPKPYILVGHSMAGIYLRPFIKKNEQDIAGIIFAEAAHPQQIKKASPQLLKMLRIPSGGLIKLAVNTGLYRIIFSLFPLSPEIPFGHPLHRIERDFFYRSYKKTLAEVKNDQLNFADAEQYTSFGNLPLTVIMGSSEIRFAKIKDTAVKNEFRRLVNEVQHDLLNLSSNSRLVKAPNSGHLLQINDAALLISEIKQLLPGKKERTTQPDTEITDQKK